MQVRSKQGMCGNEKTRRDLEMKSMVKMEKEEERTRKGEVEEWKAATQH